MGQAEFPRTQFCHDHDMTENLMMAKDDAKSRKVSATYPSVILSPLCQSKDAMLPCLLCHILPYFPLALFQGKRNRKGCARSLSLAKKTFGLMGAWTGAGDKWFLPSGRALCGPSPSLSQAIPPLTGRAFWRWEKCQRAAQVQKPAPGELLHAREKTHPAAAAWKNQAQVPGWYGEGRPLSPWQPGKAPGRKAAQTDPPLWREIRNWCLGIKRRNHTAS